MNSRPMAPDNVVRQPIIPTHVLHRMEMDHVLLREDKDGHKYLLTLLDCYSKKAWIRGTLSNSLLSQIRSEEHTSELQSLMRISYAVFCLKKKKKNSHTIVNDYLLIISNNIT